MKFDAWHGSPIDGSALHVLGVTVRSQYSICWQPMRVQSSPTAPGPRQVLGPPVSHTRPCGHVEKTPGGSGGCKEVWPSPGRVWQVMLAGSQKSWPVELSHSSLSGVVGIIDVGSIV